MLRARLSSLAASLIAVLIPAAVLADQTPAPARRFVPPEAIVVAELSRPVDVLDLTLSDPFVDAVAGLPGFEKLAGNPKLDQLKRLVAFLEKQLDADWRTIARKLFGGQMTLAMLPEKGLLLVADVKDGAMLSELQRIVTTLAEADAMNKGRPSPFTSRTVKGTKLWSVQGRRMAYAISDRRLLAGSSEEIVAAALDRGPSAKSIEDVPGYRAARQAAGEASGTVWLNLAVLKQAEAAGRKRLERMNPMGRLVAGGVLEAAGDSDWAMARLLVDGTRLSFGAILPAKAADAKDPTGYAWSPDGQGTLPNLAVPGQIAAASLYRDLHAFYGNKDKLFPERTGGLVFFENMMGIFFSGRDLAEEVLAEAKPEIRVVVARQKYAGPAPAVQIPAFAVAFHVRHPEQFGEIMEGAWQKALGLVNITRGQKAEMGLIIDRPTYNGTQFSMAYFPSVPGEDDQQRAMRFNFRPSLVRMGQDFVLASSDDLAKHLIDALKKEAAAPVKPIAGCCTLAEIDGGAVAAALAPNREALVRQNMLSQAASQEDAEARVGVILGLLEHLDRIRLSIGRTTDEVRASLDVDLQ